MRPQILRILWSLTVVAAVPTGAWAALDLRIDSSQAEAVLALLEKRATLSWLARASSAQSLIDVPSGQAW